MGSPDRSDSVEALELVCELVQFGAPEDLDSDPILVTRVAALQNLFRRLLPTLRSPYDPDDQAIQEDLAALEEAITGLAEEAKRDEQHIKYLCSKSWKQWAVEAARCGMGILHNDAKRRVGWTPSTMLIEGEQVVADPLHVLQ